MATTLNCALPPAATVCAAGAVAMVGTLGRTTVTVALADGTLVEPLVTTTAYAAPLSSAVSTGVV